MDKAPINNVICNSCFNTMIRSEKPVMTVHRLDGSIEDHYVFKCLNQCIPPQVLETKY